MPKRTDIETILIIGAGPIVIGQACEFDYSGVQAIKALKAEGYVEGIRGKSGGARLVCDPAVTKMFEEHSWAWNDNPFLGTRELNGLKVIKLLGCVNTTPEYTDQHLVINGASDLFHKIYGKDGDGFHARSALGFAQLPTGAAVEVEAIFEVVA
jgi:hypothetical protein